MNIERASIKAHRMGTSGLEENLRNNTGALRRNACSLGDTDDSDVQAVKMSRFLQMEVEEPVSHSLIKTASKHVYYLG